MKNNPYEGLEARGLLIYYFYTKEQVQKLQAQAYVKGYEKGYDARIAEVQELLTAKAEVDMAHEI